MRYSIFIITSLVAILSFTSCEDFLKDEPESVLGQVDFFTTPTRINQGVLGCYAGMKNIMNDEWLMTELRSDNTCVSATGSSSTRRQELTNLAHFALLPSEVVVQEYWYNTFQNISNINAVLPSVLDNSYITIEDDRAQYEAELRFIRAYHYFTLVNLFGDMFKVTTVIGPLDAKKIGRSPVSEIYNEIIIPDLIIAAESAPSSYIDTDIGRVTKWAAKSLLAKAYVTMGGSENLALAKPLLEEVLGDSPHGLLSNFADISDPTKEMNSEIIFAVRYKGAPTSNGSEFWENFAPQNSGTEYLKKGSADGDNNPTFEIMDQFNSDTADYRAVASFDLYQLSSTRFAAFITKYMDDKIQTAGNAENDWIVLRYADMELLYAEVLAQDGNFASAHIPVNNIRRRAGEWKAEAAPFTSKEMALDSVYHERKLELAFENHRWFDLLRMNKSYNDPNKAMDIIKLHTFTTDWEALYSLFDPLPPPAEANYTNEHLLLPIPQYEIDANIDITIPQNPGY